MRDSLAPSHPLRPDWVETVRGRSRASPGFTLIEFVITLALVGILALAVVPLYDAAQLRNKESELRSALRQIRSALDAYKAAVDNGVIARKPGDSGYPASLQVLVDGVDTVAQTPLMAAVGAAGLTSPAPGAGPGNPGYTGGLAAPSPFSSGTAAAPTVGLGLNAPTASGLGFASGTTGGPGGAPAAPMAGAAPAASIPAHLVFLRQIPRDPFAPDPGKMPEEQWATRAYGSISGDFNGGDDVFDVASRSTATGINGVPYQDW
jgi:prepilin-type N-terminal cleavage/methylation domain-containing protein